MIAAILAVILTGFHPHQDCMCYAYTNRDGTQEIYVSQHYYEDLVAQHWCIKVYDRTEDQHKVHVCVI